MKALLFGIVYLMSSTIQALEYNVQFENEHVHVAKAKIMPHEEIGLHRDQTLRVTYLWRIRNPLY